MSRKFKTLLAVIMLPVMLLINGCKLAFWEKDEIEEGTYVLEKVSIYMTQEHSIAVNKVSLDTLMIYTIDGSNNSIPIGGYESSMKTVYVEGFKRDEDNPLVIEADEEEVSNSFESASNYKVRLVYEIVCEHSSNRGHRSTDEVEFDIKIETFGKKYVKELDFTAHDYTMAFKLEFKKA